MKEIESIKDKIKDLEEVVCEQKKIAVYFADECSEKDKKIESLEKQIEGYNKYDNLLSSLDEKLRKAGEIANDADKRIAEANKEKDKAIELAHKSEKAKQIAEEEKSKAEREKEAAVLKQKLAEKTANAAVTDRLKAEKDKSIAISEMQNAVKKMNNAICEKIKAENEKKNVLLLQQKSEKEKEEAINEKNHLEEQLHNATKHSCEQVKELVNKLGTGEKCDLLRDMYDKYSYKSNPSALFNDFEYTIRDIIGEEKNFSTHKWKEFINLVNRYRGESENNNFPPTNGASQFSNNIRKDDLPSSSKREKLRDELSDKMNKLSTDEYISVLKYTFLNIDDDTARDLMDALDKKINNGRND